LVQLTATLALGLCLNGTAQAEYVDAKLIGSPSNTFNLVLGSTHMSVNAGALIWQKTGGSPNIANTFTTYCVELNQHVWGGPSFHFDVVPVSQVPQPGVGTPTPGSGMGADKALLLRELWGTFFSAATTADLQTAFQIAVWEIVFENPTNGYSVYTGTFKEAYSSSEPGYVGQAQTWLNWILTHDGPLASLTGLSSPDYQDQITAVPAPSGLLLLGLGGVGLFGAARRTRRK